MNNGSIKDPIRDDYRDFQRLDEALSHLGMTHATKSEIYFLVACILHLGNVSFEHNLEDAHDGCRVSKHSDHTLAIVAELLGVDSLKLRQALVSRVMPSRGGTSETAIS